MSNTIRRIQRDSRNDGSKQTSYCEQGGSGRLVSRARARDLQIYPTTEINTEKWSEIVHAGRVQTCRIRTDSRLKQRCFPDGERLCVRDDDAQQGAPRPGRKRRIKANEKIRRNAWVSQGPKEIFVLRLCSSCFWDGMRCDTPARMT
jgi:hypothetical protein